MLFILTKQKDASILFHSLVFDYNKLAFYTRLQMCPHWEEKMRPSPLTCI